MSRTVIHKLRGRPTSDGAGVRMTRVIGTPALDHFDPFLLLDEFRSDDPSDYVAGCPDPPHRGYETVTYMLAGRMRHQDNQGNRGLLEAGSVQWMTAGRGIVHSELPEQEGGRMEGFQLWLNLAAKDKMTAPWYRDIQSAEIPQFTTPDGVTVRVIAGDATATCDEAAAGGAGAAGSVRGPRGRRRAQLLRHRRIRGVGIVSRDEFRHVHQHRWCGRLTCERAHSHGGGSRSFSRYHATGSAFNAAIILGIVSRSDRFGSQPSNLRAREMSSA